MRILLILLILPQFSFSQSLTPTVVGSCGDYFAGSNANLSWTLGEIMTESYFGSSNQLTQGFHQPTRSDVGIDEEETASPIRIFPNPARDNVTLIIPDNEGIITVSIFSVTGELLALEYYTGNGPQDIDLSAYADGLYLIQLTNEDQEIIDITKIQKTK